MADDRTAGQVIDDRYELRALLGQGGMGVVWRAYDSLVGREVAVKEIRFPAIVGAEGRAALCERLREDARRAAVMNHPAVVRVLHVVDEGERPFVVTELVQGPTLAERVEAGGPLLPEQVAAIGVDLLDALAAAHALGLVHRFVQPAKVLLRPEGGARLCDFGLAALVGDPLVTSTGAIGSVSYMAPEQNGRPLGDAATDVWSVGATLFFAVEGRPPFDAGAAKATLAAIAGSPPRPLLRAGGLRPVLDEVLVKDPAARLDVPSFRRRLAGLTGLTGLTELTGLTDLTGLSGLSGLRGVAGPAGAGPAAEPEPDDDFFAPPGEAGGSSGGERPWYERESLADPAERSFFEYVPLAPAPLLAEPVLVEPVVEVAPEVVEVAPEVVEPEVVEPEAVEHLVVEPVVAPGGPDDGVWTVGVAFGPDDDRPADDDDRPPGDRDDDFWPGPGRGTELPPPPGPPAADEPEPPAPMEPLPPAVALGRMFSPDVERPPPPYVDAVPPDDPPPRSLWPLPRPWRPGAAFLAGAIIVVLVFLVVTGTRYLTGRDDQVARTQADTVNWVTYRDPATGFALEHPATWRVEPNADVTDFRDPASSAALRVAVQEPPRGTPQQVWTDLEKRFITEHPSYKRVKLEPAVHDGREAAVWEFTWTDTTGTPLHNSDLAVNVGGRAFALNFQTRADEWTRLNSLFDRFTSSFEPPPPR